MHPILISCCNYASGLYTYMGSINWSYFVPDRILMLTLRQ